MKGFRSDNKLALNAEVLYVQPQGCSRLLVPLHSVPVAASGCTSRVIPWRAHCNSLSERWSEYELLKEGLFNPGKRCPQDEVKQKACKPWLFPPSFSLKIKFGGNFRKESGVSWVIRLFLPEEQCNVEKKSNHHSNPCYRGILLQNSKASPSKWWKRLYCKFLQILVLCSLAVWLTTIVKTHFFFFGFCWFCLCEQNCASDLIKLGLPAGLWYVHFICFS